MPVLVEINLVSDDDDSLTMISDRISDDIPPQMKNLNMVIPILMYYLTLTHLTQLVVWLLPFSLIFADV